MHLTQTEDRDLAERAAAGDDDAFAALVDRHREAPAAHADEWEDVQTVEGLDVLVAEAWEFEHTLRLWAGLPRRQRHALAMSVLEGRSLAEIGDTFGVSVDAAKSLVVRSRRSLAHAVAADDRCEVRVGRRRHLLLFPSRLIERTRDAATFATHHEPASLITEACAGACAAVIGSGGTAAVVAVVLPDPRIIAVVERAEAKRKPERTGTPPAPVPVATATPAPVVTAAPPRSSSGAIGRPAPPKPSYQETLRRRRALALVRRRRVAGRPPGYPNDDPGPYAPAAGGGSTDPKISPTATPPPGPTPSPAPTAQPTPQPTPAANPAG